MINSISSNGDNGSKPNQVKLLYRDENLFNELPTELSNFLLQKNSFKLDKKTDEFLLNHQGAKLFKGDILYKNFRVSFLKKTNTQELLDSFPKQSSSYLVPKLTCVIQNDNFSPNHNISVFKVNYRAPVEIDSQNIFFMRFAEGALQDRLVEFRAEIIRLKNQGITHPGVQDINQRIFDEDGCFYLDGPTLFKKTQNGA